MLGLGWDAMGWGACVQLHEVWFTEGERGRGESRKKGREMRQERKERGERKWVPCCRVDATSTFNSHFNIV